MGAFFFCELGLPAQVQRMGSPPAVLSLFLKKLAVCGDGPQNYNWEGGNGTQNDHRLSDGPGRDGGQI